MGYRCNASEVNATLKAYGDVSGPGVIVGFLGTAYLAVGLVFLHYIFVFDPDENPFYTGLPAGVRQLQGPIRNEWSANPVDKLAKRSIQWVFKRCGLFKARIFGIRSPGFGKAILMMCDIQILTGIGILLSGYLALHDGLSAYHFQMIVRIAWFSNITHLAGLSVLRNYLHNRPVEKWIRLSLMVFLTILLLVSMIPTLFFNWADEYDCSASLVGSKAICFIDFREALKLQKQNCIYADQSLVTNGPELSTTDAFQSGIVSMLLVFFSFASRLIKLLASTSTAAKTIRKGGSYVWKSVIRRSVVNRDFKSQGLLMTQMTLLLACRIYLDVLLSSLSDVYWLITSTVWGTRNLFKEKSYVVVDENDWTFGQILPVFLLVGPVVSLALNFLDATRQHQSDIDPNVEDFNSSTDVVGFELVAHPQPSTPTGEHDDPSTQELMANPNSEGIVNNHNDEINQLLETMFENSYDLNVCPGTHQAVILVCLQVIIITDQMFVKTGSSESTTAGIMVYFLTYTVLFFSTTYLFIRTTFIVQYALPGPAKPHKRPITLFLVFPLSIILSFFPIILQSYTWIELSCVCGGLVCISFLIAVLDMMSFLRFWSRGRLQRYRT